MCSGFPRLGFRDSSMSYAGAIVPTNARGSGNCKSEIQGARRSREFASSRGHRECQRCCHRHNINNRRRYDVVVDLPATVPVSVPTPVVMVKVPEYVKVKGKLPPPSGMQPSIWSVTVPTALLPGYVAVKFPPRKLQPPVPEPAEIVPVTDELARSARPGLATVTLTPELNSVPPELKASDAKK